MRGYLFFLLIIILFSACSDVPEAGFSVSESLIFRGDTVQFTNNSLNAKRYQWEFGDGGISEEENPSYEYKYAGKYYVKLTAFGKQKRKRAVQYKTIFVSECPTGYTGPNCSNEIMPTSIKISEIRLMKFPPRKEGGVFWDMGGSDGPDIYQKILNKEGNTIFTSSKKFNVNMAVSDLLFVLDDFSIITVNEPFTIAVYDYDETSSDDLMGSNNFIIYDADNGFPETVTITGDDISLELTYEYSWE